jgi:hypothetical protein
MLSIMRRGTVYQVRYAASNPHGVDREPYLCPTEDALLEDVSQVLIPDHRACPNS